MDRFWDLISPTKAQTFDFLRPAKPSRVAKVTKVSTLHTETYPAEPLPARPKINRKRSSPLSTPSSSRGSTSTTSNRELTLVHSRKATSPLPSGERRHGVVKLPRKRFKYELSSEEENEDEGEEEEEEEEAKPSDKRRRGSVKSSPKPSAKPSAKPSPKTSSKPPAKRTKHEPQSEEEEEEQVEPKATTKITQAEKEDLGIDTTPAPYEPVTVDHPDHIGWAQEEVDLFNRLNERGTVPLIYSEWHLDFPTIPDVLFSSNKDKILIKALEGTEFRGKFPSQHSLPFLLLPKTLPLTLLAAIKALTTLLGAGNRLRDQILASKNPAPNLARAITAYIKWSTTDSALSSQYYIPAIAVTAAHVRETVQQTVDRNTAALRRLAAQYRLAWGYDALDEDEEQPQGPILYGVIAYKTIMAFVTYDAGQAEGGEARNLALFDWNEEGQDVWNAFAVALLVCSVREWALGLDLSEVESEGGKMDTDPDE